MAVGLTSLALLGAGAVAGAFAKKKLTAPKPAPETIISPEQSAELAARRPPAVPATAPPSVPQAAVRNAQDAAVKQRRRAAAGASPSRPAPTGSILAGRFEPRTLVGY